MTNIKKNTINYYLYDYYYIILNLIPTIITLAMRSGMSSVVVFGAIKILMSKNCIIIVKIKCKILIYILHIIV